MQEAVPEKEGNTFHAFDLRRRLIDFIPGRSEEGSKVTMFQG